MTLPTRMTAALTRRPRTWVAGTVAVVISLAWPAGSVPTDNSLAVWFVEDDPALLEYRSFLERFGNDEVVVIAYRTGSPGEAGADRARGAAEWRLQERAAAAVGAVEGVDRVMSGASWVAALGAEAAEPTLRRLGLTGEGGAVALYAWLEPRPDMDRERGRVLDDVAAAVEATLGEAGREARFAGTGVLYEGLNRQTERDGAVFLGLALVVMTVLLRPILGSWRATLLALTAPLAATAATTGLVGWTGGSLNVVLAALPALILVIGLADAVHILLAWFRARRRDPPRDRAERGRLAARVAAEMAAPTLFTSITTAVGFLALASSRMEVIRDLGLFAAAGVLLVWALVMVAMTAGLSLLDVRPPARAWGGRLSPPLARLGAWIPRHRGRVIVGFGAVALLLGAGVARVEVDTHTLGLLPDSHPVVEDSRWIEANLGRYTPLELVVESPSGRVLSPPVMEAVAEWSRAARARPEVGRTLGLVDLLEALEVDPAAGEAALEEALALYRDATGDDLSDYLTADRDALRVTAFVDMGTARHFAATGAALVADGERALGDVATIRATGYLPLYVRIIDYTVSSTLLGLGLAFGGVFLTLAFLFRAPGAVAAAVAPNLFPVLAVFGAMGWLGIPLDIATATVGAIVLGIAVDDTVHFLHRYRSADPGAGIAGAMAWAGPGMVLTSLVLILGLAVLLAAGSRSIVYFGLLTTLAVAAALVADLLLLPALLRHRAP